LASKTGAGGQGPGARKNTLLYIAILAGCFVVGYLVSLTSVGVRFDDILYDVLTKSLARIDAASLKTNAVVVAIDEDTLRARGGMRNVRQILAGALDQLREIGPRVVAVDVLLADATDRRDDARLAASLLATKNLILPCELIDNKWEDPLPEFKTSAVALGHVHLAEVSADGVNRQIPLEKKGGGDRRWALSLEAFYAFRGEPVIESSANPSLQIGRTLIPEQKGANGRPMMVRYLPPRTIPIISVLRIPEYRDYIRGSAVFLGITALSAAHDRLTNSYGDSVPGVEVHAQAFETMELGRFLIPSGDAPVLALCIAITCAAGLIFVFVPGWWAYALDFLLLGAAFSIPFESLGGA